MCSIKRDPKLNFSSLKATANLKHSLFLEKYHFFQTIRCFLNLLHIRNREDNYKYRKILNLSSKQETVQMENIHLKVPRVVPEN